MIYKEAVCRNSWNPVIWPEMLSNSSFTSTLNLKQLILSVIPPSLSPQSTIHNPQSKPRSPSPHTVESPKFLSFSLAFPLPKHLKWNPQSAPPPNPHSNPTPTCTHPLYRYTQLQFSRQNSIFSRQAEDFFPEQFFFGKEWLHFRELESAQK